MKHRIVKRRETRRGVHKRIEFVSANGARLAWAELSEEARQELWHTGFRGFNDFLQKAENLANEQLALHDLPTDWPRPVKLPDEHGDVDGFYVPDECEAKALRDGPPNAEAAAKLKLDLYRCREHMKHAEFRSRPPPPNTIGATPAQRASEYMYFGVIAGLSYWRLLANVRFEKAVAEKERRLANASALPDDDIRRVLRAEPSFKMAAAKLGITERAIRNRIPAGERKNIQQEKRNKKRKS